MQIKLEYISSVIELSMIYHYLTKDAIIACEVLNEKTGRN